MRFPSSKVNKYRLRAFYLPALILLCVYFLIGAYPFGEKSFFSLDLAGQYVHFYAELRDTVFGDGSLFYSFSRSLGGEFLGIVAYYLASPFTLLVIIFPKKLLNLSVALMILLKTGTCGLTMHYYLEKSGKTEGIKALIFSVMYALSAYVVVYGSNIMWLDGVYMLPLLAFGTEKAVGKGKIFPFSLCLGYSLFTNYYIGYMLCIFSVIYFFYCFFASSDKERIPFFPALAKFAIGAIVAAALAAVMLLPAYRSLTFGKSEFTSPDFSFRFLKDFIVTVSKLFPCTYDKVDFDGSAYLYCGIIALILTPLYFVLTSIPKRRKIALGVLFFFLIASISISTLDLFWHGFQFPNWLDYRYSFIISFLMCSVSAEVFEKRKEIEGKVFIFTVAFILMLLMVIQVIGPESFNPIDSLGFSILCLGIYLAVITGMERTAFAKYLSPVLAVLVCLELLVSSAVSLSEYSADVRHMRIGRVEDNIAKYAPAANEIKKTDNGFYRTELYGDRLNNDPFSVGIYGLTSSTSTVNSSVISFLSELGYVSYSNYTRYREINPASDALLSVKYIISEKEIENGVHKKTDIIAPDGLTVYENQNALSPVFLCDEKIKELELDNKSAFDSINELYSALTGEEKNIFSALYLKNVGWSGAVPRESDGIRFYTPAGSMETWVMFTLKTTPGQEIYCQFPSIYRNQFEVWVGDELRGNLNGRDTYTCLYLGKADGDEMTVKLKWEEGDVSMFKDANYFYALDTETLSDASEKLNSGKMIINNHSETKITGALNASENGTVFTSIPYDSDFSVYVDGEKTETFKVCDTLLAFDVTEGEHTVKIVFVPKSFITGAIISSVGVIALICIYLTENGKLKIAGLIANKRKEEISK